MCDKNESDIKINMNTEYMEKYGVDECYECVNFGRSLNMEQTGFDK